MSHGNETATGDPRDDSSRRPVWDEWLRDVEREVELLGGVPAADFLLLAERLYARLALKREIKWQSRHSLGFPRNAAREIFKQAITIDNARREWASHEKKIGADEYYRADR